MSKNNQNYIPEGKREVVPQKHITIIGDSTIDNKIWLYPFGPYGYAVLDLFGYKRSNSTTRIKKSHWLMGKPHLSVVENLMSTMPNYTIHDLANDGFTTTDCLYGELRNTAFSYHKPAHTMSRLEKFCESRFYSLFPNTLFYPLGEIENIQNAEAIVLSVGGNNFRRFLQDAADYKSNDKEKYISYIKTYHQVLAELKKEYLQIVNKIRKINNDAKLILMTQYYPSASQNDYNLYPFIKELGETLHLGKDPSNPMDVIHEIMQQTYVDILKNLKDKNAIVVDVTSSLNPYDKSNHACQIEPSVTGGKKIAQMLNHVLVKNVKTGFVYRFLPDFFKPKNEQDDSCIIATKFEEWIPEHPVVVNLTEKHIDTKAVNKALTLLTDIKIAGEKFVSKSIPVFNACRKVYDEGQKLLVNLKNDEEASAFINSLEKAKEVAVNPRNIDAIRNLHKNGTSNTVGKSNSWKEFSGSLMILAGLAMGMLGLLTFPMSLGLSSAAIVSGVASVAAGCTLFFNGNQRAFASSITDLAKTAHSNASEKAKKQKAVNEFSHGAIFQSSSAFKRSL